MIVAALVGMAGAGKSEAARLFMNNGFIRIRFGDITDEEIKKRELVLNEENERSVLAMVIHLAIGLVSSLIITNRRQLS